MKPFSRTEARAAAIRWLVALGRPDADALERVEEAQDELDSTDPVRLAIEYCLEPETPERKARANAALAYTAERARSGPYAFDRVMVEMTGRFSFPTARAEVLDRCIAICEHRLGEVEESSAELEAGRAFLGLALAYRSSEHSRVSQQYEAEWLMERALANLDSPEGEPAPALDPLRREILARVLEMRADHFAAHGDHAKCQQILEEIGPLLADCEMPGRSASVWCKAGRSSERTRDYEHAVSMLEAAQRDLPPGLDQDLQCRILCFERSPRSAKAISPWRRSTSPGRSPSPASRLLSICRCNSDYCSGSRRRSTVERAKPSCTAFPPFAWHSKRCIWVPRSLR